MDGYVVVLFASWAQSISTFKRYSVYMSLRFLPNTQTHTKQNQIFPGERFQQSRASLRMNFEPKTKCSSLSLDCIEVRTHFEISSHFGSVVHHMLIHTFAQYRPLASTPTRPISIVSYTYISYTILYDSLVIMRRK